MILALVLTWSAVTQDCRGGLELAVTYQVRTERITVIGARLCEDGISICPVEQRTFLTVPTDQVELELSDPQLGGGVFWWDPVAIDAAGNRSDAGCVY